MEQRYIGKQATQIGGTDTGKNCFFASSNTSEGFRSDFSSVFGEANRRIILKGGPGTGKSSLLGAVATAAEEKGLTVERFYCSSDPQSLDGILIPDRGVALLDGTAPHEADPVIPGAADEIWNLGEFWDREQLQARRQEIEVLQKQKAAGYRMALSGLAAEGKLLNEQRQIVGSLLLKEKLAATVTRWIGTPRKGHGRGRERGSRSSDGAKMAIRHIETVGMRGRVYLPGLERAATKTVGILPYHGSELLLLEELRAQAVAAGYSVIVSRHPLQPMLPNAVYLEQSGVLYLSTGASAGAVTESIHPHRFFAAGAISAQRQPLRALSKAVDRIEPVVEVGFLQMRDRHFRMEEIYGEAMDFVRKEQVQAEWISALLA